MKKEEKCRQLRIQLKNQELEVKSRHKRFLSEQGKATGTVKDIDRQGKKIVDVAGEAGIDIAVSMLPKWPRKTSMPGPVLSAIPNFFKLKQAVQQYFQFWDEASRLENNAHMLKDLLKEAQEEFTRLDGEIQRLGC